MTASSMKHDACRMCSLPFYTHTEAGALVTVCSPECADTANDRERDGLMAEQLVTDARAAREHLLELASRFEAVATGEYGDADVVLVVGRIDSALEEFRGRFS